MIDAIHPCPDALTPTHWEKKKGSLPPDSELPGKLKVLHRKHEAIDWKPFGAGWSKSCKAADELEEAFELRDRNYRSSVFALKREAHEVAKAALLLAKDKAAAKPATEAAKSIADAATRFVEGVDVGAEGLKKEFDLAQAGFTKGAKADAKEDAKKDAKTSEGGDDDEAGSTLLDPQRLLAQLNLCKREPARRVNFGFVDGHDKQPAVLALHPKTSAYKLFSSLQAETGVKAGAHGTAWVEDTVLTLQLDKPLAGLVKKVRVPLRTCGFRVTKVVIWNADGSVFEQDEAQQDAQDEQQGYAQRRAALQERYLAALQGPPATVVKLRRVGEFADEKAASGNLTVALQALDQLGKLIGEPQELHALLDEMKKTPLQPEWESKKDRLLSAAAEELRKGNYEAARRVLDALSAHRLPTKPLPAVPGRAKPLPTLPERAPGVQSTKAVVHDGLDDSKFTLDDKGPAPVLDKPAFRDAALAPSSAVAAAQQRLAEEEEAFERQKKIRKAGKIMASESNKAKPKEDKQSIGDRVLDKLHLGKKKDKDTKEPNNRIDQALDNKKADDELKKYDKPLPAVGAAGMLDAALAKGVGATLDAGNQGDDIASAAGLLTASTAAAASSILDLGRAWKLRSNTDGAERAQHSQEMANAFGNVVGNLLNMSKASATVAKHANAAEAASAVPILGIVAAVPELIIEINQLRSAIARLVKQEKVHAQLEKAIEGGDNSQATLYTVVSAFIDRDSEAIGKGIAKVALDATKIAGHGVTLGGITGPIGIALVGIGAAGKALMSGVDGIQELVAAHEANDRRKKLQPTLHALRDLKALVKDKPSDAVTKNVTDALEALAQVEKGTPAHAAALDELTTKAAAFETANPNSKEAEFAHKLVDQAKQEKKSWESGAGADSADPLAQKKEMKGGDIGALEAQHRNARKLMGKDPQLAAQTLLDQALREGGPGGPASAVLKSFGIEEAQVYGGVKVGDERIASNREMRQKILFELGADDETAKTLIQAVGEAKDSAKKYLSMRSKHAALDDYMKAKNLLQVKGESKRGKGWQIKMDLISDDIEEKKEALRGRVEYLLAEKDIDEALAAQVMLLLAPSEEKASA